MEATMVCIDNSEWSRCGDFTPTRFQAQADAVNLLTGAKTQAHPENNVGVLTMAGKTPRVLVTPTPELGKVLNSMSEILIEGESNLCASLQISQLALKHRVNKNQRQRIVLFIGSPVTEDKEKLVKIAKKLKKNSVAVDIVSFGCEDDNNEKLDAFFQAVNSNNNSHLVTVPPGPVLSDVLIGSPIFQGEGGSGYGFGSGAAMSNGAEGFEFGVDPNIDPDLALALRVSLEEERARQNAASAGAAASAAAGDASAPAPAGGAAAATPAPAAATGAGDMDLDEDALLQQALAMSMLADNEDMATPAPTTTAAESRTAPPAPAPAAPAAAPDTDMDGIEDEELRMALALSMEDSGPGETKEKEEK